MSEGRRFKVLGALGSGGFGTVYRAELLGEGGFRKPVALKILNPNMVDHKEVARRFRDEARVLGLVSHSSIVAVDGLVWLDGRWAVVMEYVHGIDLRGVLKQGAIPLGPALNITRNVADALHVAYHQTDADGSQLRLLHRDIKPSNIQLTAAGEVKLLDFGTARADFEGREAETRSIAFGTLDYMSPERLDFIDGPAGDVYALGAVLYEMICGAPIGKTSAHPERHRQRLTEALQHIWDVTNGEHETFVRFLAEMLAFDPEDRPRAREVERRCAQLHQDLRAERLRDWAEVIVPPLMEKRHLSQDDQLSGSTLIERMDAPRLDSDKYEPEEGAEAALATTWQPISDAHDLVAPQTPPSIPKPSRRGSTVALIGGISGIALIVMMTAGVVLFSWWRSQPASTQEVLGDRANATKASTVAEAGPIHASTEAASEPTPPAAPVPAEPEATPAPTPPPIDAPPPEGRVRVTGDARSVVLKGNGLRRGPGAVPPGTYRIFAEFPGRDSMVAGRVTVVSGRTVTIHCVAAFTRCTPG